MVKKLLAKAEKAKQEEDARQAEQARQEEEAKAKRRRQVFVSEPGPRSLRVFREVDVFGRPDKTITAVDPEGASHWDARLWRCLQ
jgi:hypothetical protein